MEHGLKAGIYKVKSLSSGAVLTATLEGSPRAVKVAPWEDSDTQKWKVKTRQVGDKTIQIIRNETVKNNEVSKKCGGECPDGKEGDMAPVEWKFVPVEGQADTFTLNNGIGFLTNTGTDNRICFCDLADGSDKDNQTWTFEFLSEITKA